MRYREGRFDHSHSVSWIVAVRPVAHPIVDEFWYRTLWVLAQRAWVNASCRSSGCLDIDLLVKVA